MKRSKAKNGYSKEYYYIDLPRRITKNDCFDKPNFSGFKFYIKIDGKDDWNEVILDNYK